MTHRSEIRKLANDQAVLAGAGLGAAVFGALVASRPTQTEPTVQVLDFHGVDVATASFLREAIVAYRDYCRATLPAIYPVLANLGEAVEEELRNLLVQRSDAIACCDLSDSGHVSRARVIGALESKQAEALRLVIDAGAVDAPTLARADKGTGKVGPTAWNNRLAALAKKSLVLCSPEGRSVVFRPVLKGLSYGS
jgi:hypothetical protein